MIMHENGWESMKFYKMDDVDSNNQRSKKCLRRSVPDLRVI